MADDQVRVRLTVVTWVDRALLDHLCVCHTMIMGPPIGFYLRNTLGGRVVSSVYTAVIAVITGSSWWSTLPRTSLA